MASYTDMNANPDGDVVYRLGKSVKTWHTPAMLQHVIIDGNNLLHALPVHAPVPAVGRETLVRLVERWAIRCRRSIAKVTLVFDGPIPQRGLAGQMSSDQLTVHFSAPATADDLIVEVIQKAPRPDELRVVTSDSAILHEAKCRRCRWTDSASFSRELFAKPASPSPSPHQAIDKPTSHSPDETQEWLDAFGITDKDASPDAPEWWAY